EDIKRVAYNPNSIIVYNNFNFINRVRDLAGGKQDHFVNLTTSLLVSYPSLNGPII
ncbi:hypothetical protein ACRALDRAFT_2107762, partial [Sodiomyces alcalophilus JCM 7366]|uniref:uncharacterized protein n=1 Tax=Sodiomyces alcalophilus JCM 7366 TaxID=591952 RepID=UPI0039B4DC23